MLNRQFFWTVLAVVLFGLAGDIQTIAADTETININTATAEELMQLNGVGPKYADEIIACREEYGPFEAPEELMQVKGIGPKTFEENQEIIIVEEPEDEPEEY